MNIKEFGNFLIDENACIDLVRKVKEDKGVVCPKCGSKDHYFNVRYRSHDCKKCRYRTTLRSGTVMESSKLPFHYWITSMYFMTLTKKSFSALEMQRILGHKRYEPIWAMMHKIRASIGQFDEKQILFGNIEMVSSKIITMTRKSLESDRTLTKPGQKKDIRKAREVELFISITPPQKPVLKSLRKTAFKHVYAFVVPELGKNECLVKYETKEKGKFPDKGLSTFRTINNKMSIMRQFHPVDYEKDKLHWGRTLVSNFRRVINGIHHNISEQYLQNYLNEFSFKTSSHKKDLFSELLAICIDTQWYNSFRYENG
ncbi:MAG: IS1595 family transposase [Bacteroidales bacterium]|nr:IS1595 family transposase [Bacteroidales bacterium]